MASFKKALSLAISIALLLVLLSACGTSPEPEVSPTPSVSAEPVIGGDITVGISQDLDETLDPHMMVSAGTREVLFNVYEGLVKPDTDGNLVPAVASEYNISDDGTVFTFELREGVNFHNGETVTIEDVVFSVSRVAGLLDTDVNGERDSVLVDGFDAVESVESPDAGKVVVTLSEPNIEFLALMTVAVIPEGIDPNQEVIGTGPFKLVSRAPQESIVLEKFEDYWGTASYVDSVTLKIIESGETVVMSLKSGALDMATHLTDTQAKELGTDYTIAEGTMNLVQAIYLNNDVEPFDNLKVRQALSYAIDRQSVLDFLAGGRGVVVGSSMYPAFTKYFRADLADYYSTDIERAQELLAEAGYEDGFEMTVTVPSNYQPHIDTATVIAQQYKQIGVTVNVELVDWNSWLNDVYFGRDYQATVVGVDAATMTGRAMLERFTSDYDTNFINFQDEEYDSVFRAAAESTDDAERVVLYGRLQEILAEQAANVYIQDLSDLVVMGNGVQGYEFYPLYVMDLSKVYFTG